MCQATFSIDAEDKVTHSHLGNSHYIRVSPPEPYGGFTIVLPYGVTSDAVDKIIAAFNEALAPRREEIAQKIRELV